jgi:N-acetylglucosaminyl-diphospho-decaprenol L-rhamnosyltransferase
VDVVVVTWNSRAMVLRCLESIDASAVEHIVVVDNASGDGTAEAVRDLHAEAELLRLEHEQGLASAYNRGAERGSAELILFLNDDVLVDESSLSALVAVLRDSTAAVAAAGRLVDPGDGHTQTEYLPRPFPTLSSYVAMLAGGGRRRPFAARVSIDDDPVPVDQPPGACLLVRREAFAAVGAWDEDFAFWYEDVDLARRLQSIGDVLFVPSAAFPHVGGQSAARLSQAEVVSRHYRGALLYAGKHFRAPSRLGAGLLFALVGAARLPFTRDRDSRRAYARVLRDGLRTATGRSLVPR